ncbi:MAG: chemotaxis protein CheW [Solirubrobacteraceae bacterium]
MSQDSNARQLVVFTLCGEQYALPIQQVQEIIRYTQPRPVASSDHWARGVLNLRGKIVPVYDLAARLGVTTEISEQSKIVIVESGSQTSGVIVDEVDEVLTVESQQFEQAPSADPALVDSIAKIGDRLVVLLSPSTIFGGVELAAA